MTDSLVRPKKYTEQEILNRVFDRDNNRLKISSAGFTAHAADIDAHMAQAQQTILIGQGDYGGNRQSGGVAILVADTIYFYPFSIPRTRTYDRIMFELTTVAAGGKIGRLGIYLSSDAHIPTTLIDDTGTVAVDSGTDIKLITISEQLTKGNYFLSFVSDGAPIVRWVLPVNSFLGGTVDPSGSFDGAMIAGYSKASVGAGALADPAVTGLTKLVRIVPTLGLRVLSND